MVGCSNPPGRVALGEVTHTSNLDPWVCEVFMGSNRINSPLSKRKYRGGFIGHDWEWSSIELEKNYVILYKFYLNLFFNQIIFFDTGPENKCEHNI